MPPARPPEFGKQSETPDGPGRRRSLADLEVELVGAGGDRAEIAVRGELDLYTTPVLEQSLSNLTASQARQLVMDVSNLSFIDVSGIDALARAASRLGEEGGSLVLRSPSAFLCQLLELAGLTGHIVIDHGRRDHG